MAECREVMSTSIFVILISTFGIPSLILISTFDIPSLILISTFGISIFLLLCELCVLCGC